MQIPVAQQLQQATGTVARFDIEEPSLTVGGVVLRDLTGSATLIRTNRGLLVSLKVQATVHSECARCLRKISSPISIDSQEEYIPMIDAVTGARVHLDEPDDVFRIDPDFILDLREGVRQYTLISESAKPLCKPDCVGLCPSCGMDRNEGACDCPPSMDERWQTLADLTATDGEGS
ncbi:MAG: DUF177 domain-containing protein [Dehalococcoidia bacterium]